MTLWQRRDRPLVLGHRGASAHVTENTLEAFGAARDAGADGVELDARLCASGQVVVFHDQDLARMAGRGESIDQLPLDILRRIQLDGECRIPVLDEVFDAFADSDFLINVELKTNGFRGCVPLVEAVLRCVERHRIAERILLSSFDPIALARIRQRDRRIATGFLFHDGQLTPFRRAWPAAVFRPQAVHPHHALVTRANIAHWHRRGFAVNTWTVDDPATQRRLAALGVDAIVSNAPGACLAALGDKTRNPGTTA